MWTLFNGRWYFNENDHLRDDESLWLQGFGLLETFLCLGGGRAPLWDYHHTRLIQSADRLQWSYPVIAPPPAPPQGQSAVARLVLSNRQGGTGVLRLSFRPVPEPRDFIRISMQHATAITLPSPFTNMKTTHYSLGAGTSRTQSSYDTLLVNGQGHATESLRHNVFWMVHNDSTLYTPSLATGCVAGVARTLLMTYWTSCGRPMKEVLAPFPHETNVAAMWLTNAVTGLVRVSQLGQTRLRPTIYEHPLQIWWERALSREV